MRSRFYVYVRSPLAKAEQTPLFAEDAPPAREPEYHRVRPPKFASFQSFDCAICGYPDLEHPVFLSDGGNAIAVGSGCAEKLTGRKAAEWDADLAAEVLASDEGLQRAYSMFHASLPGRVTKKFIDDAAKWANVPRSTARRAADIYKALRKVGAARKWKDRATLAKAPATPLFGPVALPTGMARDELLDRLDREWRVPAQ